MPLHDARPSRGGDLERLRLRGCVGVDRSSAITRLMFDRTSGAPSLAIVHGRTRSRCSLDCTRAIARACCAAGVSPSPASDSVPMRLGPHAPEDVIVDEDVCRPPERPTDTEERRDAVVRERGEDACDAAVEARAA